MAADDHLNNLRANVGIRGDAVSSRLSNYQMNKVHTLISFPSDTRTLRRSLVEIYTLSNKSRMS